MALAFANSRSELGYQGNPPHANIYLGAFPCLQPKHTQDREMACRVWKLCCTHPSAERKSQKTTLE